jgi:MFS transporter, YQGE family, putative transporter
MNSIRAMFGKVSKEKQLSSQAVIALMNHGIFQFGNSMSVIFVNLYLWRLTNDLMINGLFNLVSLVIAPFATLFIGPIAKKKDRLVAYRWGIFLTAFFYLCILVVQERMVDYYLFFALLKGISTAFYWLGYFTLMYDVSNNENRYRYLGLNTVVTNIAMFVGPALAGVVIGRLDELTGYTIVFLMAFIMFFVAAFGSLRIQRAPEHHRKYYLRYLPSILRREPNFAKCLGGWFIVGLPQGILMYVPQILLFHVFPNEEFIGYMNVLFFGITVAASYAISRLATTSSTRLYLMIAAAGFTLSASTLLWGIALWSVITFMSINSLFKPLQQNAYAANYYQWMDRLPLKKNFRVESIVLRETVINFGRAGGVVLFMLSSGDLDAPFIPYLVLFVMAIQFVIPAVVKKMKQPESAG